MDSSSNDNAAPAYMLTNLVDATTTFQIVDIQRYMMESIPIILQPSGPIHGMHNFAPGVRNFLPVFFVLSCFPLYLELVKVVSLFSHPSASRSLF
jgi:hypothetical protein